LGTSQSWKNAPHGTQHLYERVLSSQETNPPGAYLRVRNLSYYCTPKIQSLFKFLKDQHPSVLCPAALELSLSFGLLGAEPIRFLIN
jgi:hypothetical protein